MNKIVKSKQDIWVVGKAVNCAGQAGRCSLEEDPLGGAAVMVIIIVLLLGGVVHPLPVQITKCCLCCCWCCIVRSLL